MAWGSLNLIPLESVRGLACGLIQRDLHSVLILESFLTDTPAKFIISNLFDGHSLAVLSFN